MRERVARAFAVFLGLSIVLLAALFAARRNPGPAAAAPQPNVEAAPAIVPAASRDPAAVARGRTAFGDHGCTRCHRIEGTGNPRSPLDGVGSRLRPDRIRAFIVGDASIGDRLGPSVLRVKRGYAALPAADLDALVAYLSSLRD